MPYLHGHSLAAEGAESPVAVIGVVDAAIRAGLCVHIHCIRPTRLHDSPSGSEACCWNDGCTSMRVAVMVFLTSSTQCLLMAIIWHRKHKIWHSLWTATCNAISRMEKVYQTRQNTQHSLVVKRMMKSDFFQRQMMHTPNKTANDSMCLKIPCHRRHRGQCSPPRWWPWWVTHASMIQTRHSLRHNPNMQQHPHICFWRMTNDVAGGSRLDTWGPLRRQGSPSSSCCVGENVATRQSTTIRLSEFAGIFFYAPQVREARQESRHKCTNFCSPHLPEKPLPGMPWGNDANWGETGMSMYSCMRAVACDLR